MDFKIDRIIFVMAFLAIFVVISCAENSSDGERAGGNFAARSNSPKPEVQIKTKEVKMWAYKSPTNSMNKFKGNFYFLKGKVAEEQVRPKKIKEHFGNAKEYPAQWLEGYFNTIITKDGHYLYVWSKEKMEIGTELEGWYSTTAHNWWIGGGADPDDKDDDIYTSALVKVDLE